jgi:AraC-like DNA-binding protein
MQREHDFEVFLQSPSEKYFVANKFVAWHPVPELCGSSSWDCHGRDDIQMLCRVMDAFTRPGRGKHRSLIDASQCTSTSPITFEDILRYWAEKRLRLDAAVSSMAVVRPPGFSGAILTGLCSMIRSSYPLRVFDDVRAALDWLGFDPSSELAADLCALGRNDRSPLVTRARALLVEASGTLSLAETARRLGMSERTFQRRLTEAGSSFQVEQHTAKLTRAQSLMVTTRLNLTAIALELRFASLQHFSAWFRSAVGQPPSAWLRDRLRENERKLVESDGIA